MTRLPSGVAFGKFVACICLATCLMMAQNGYGVQVVFQLQGANSLVAAPFVNAVGLPMSGQGPGNTSLTTTYSGTITVDVDNPLNPTSITFISAEATAANSGNWLPEIGGGSEGDPEVDGDATPGVAAPANYGFFIDLGGPGVAVLYGAVRDMVLSVNSAAAIPITGGQFSPLDVGITLPQGTYEGNLSSGAFGDDVNVEDISDLIGTNTPSGSGGYSVAGNVATLTLPLKFTLAEGADPETEFSGTWTATYSLASPVDGDFNDDGFVDGADFLFWQRGGSPNPLSAGDLAIWKGAFGTAPIAAVPEPAAALLMSAAMLGSIVGIRGVRRSRTT